MFRDIHMMVTAVVLELQKRSFHSIMVWAGFDCLTRLGGRVLRSGARSVFIGFHVL